VRNEEPPTASGQDSGLSVLGFRSAESAATPGTPGPARPEPSRRSLRSRASTSDMVFRGVLRGGGTWVLVIMILVGSFLG